MFLLCVECFGLATGGQGCLLHRRPGDGPEPSRCAKYRRTDHASSGGSAVRSGNIDLVDGFDLGFLDEEEVLADGLGVDGCHALTAQLRIGDLFGALSERLVSL